MPNKIAQDMLEKKKNESAFVQLDDKENVTGTVTKITTIMKAGYKGGEVEVLRMNMKVFVDDLGEEIDKQFDCGAVYWLKEVVSQNVDVGDTIKITRNGVKGDTKTKYALEKLDKMPAPKMEVKDEDIPK